MDGGQMKERILFFAERRFAQRGVALYIAFEPSPQSESIGYAQPLVFKQAPRATVAEGPTIEFSQEDARALMDELWRCGIRPSETGSEGALAATKGHLEDMRRLVFERLKK